MMFETRAFKVSAKGKIAIMWWPERPWPEMEPIPDAVLKVECGTPLAYRGDVSEFFHSILWQKEISIKSLGARNAFGSPLAFGVERLYVSAGNSVLVHDFAADRDYTFWSAEEKWIDSIVTRADHIAVLVRDMHRIGGDIVMLSGRGDILWTSHPTFAQDDGFTHLELFQNKLLAQTWSSRAVTLDPQTGQIIQSSFTR